MNGYDWFSGRYERDYRYDFRSRHNELLGSRRYGSSFAGQDRPAYRTGGSYADPYRQAGHGSSRDDRYADEWEASGWAEVDDVEATDDEVLHEVLSNLYRDSHLDADRLDVEVENGIVRLYGQVNDYLESRYAWDDAWEAVGVRGVINEIEVDQQKKGGGVEDESAATTFGDS